MKQLKASTQLLFLLFMTLFVASRDGMCTRHDKGVRSRQKRSIPNIAWKWPRGIVPYEMDEEIENNEDIDMLKNAFAFLANRTCVKWLRRTPELTSILGHNNYVQFISADGCWSEIGNQYTGKQNLSLGEGCFNEDNVIHELLHTMGFSHTQSRSDRDQYVFVNNENIEEEKQYEYENDDTKNYVPYDLQSVMHYQLDEYGIDGKHTFNATDPNLEFLVGSTKAMTFYDIADVLLNYKCSAHCPEEFECEYGILNHNCECYCMDGFTGDDCEEVTTDQDCGGYHDVVCGDEDFLIESPEYPNEYSAGKLCRWVLEGKNGALPKIVIGSLDLPSKNPETCSDSLTVQYNLPGQTGIALCGKQENKTFVSTKESGGTLILTLESTSEGEQLSRKGFHIKVSASESSCNNPA